MRYIWTEDTGAGLHFWNLVNQILFDNKIVIVSKASNQGILDALADLLSGQNCHINLIPCNQTDGRFVAPSQGRVSHFLEELKKRSLSATVRRTLGEDIEGACGQLRARYLGMQGGF